VIACRISSRTSRGTAVSTGVGWNAAGSFRSIFRCITAASRRFVAFVVACFRSTNLPVGDPEV
jgi:hypothetical protein